MARAGCSEALGFVPQAVLLTGLASSAGVASRTSTTLPTVRRARKAGRTSVSFRFNPAAFQGVLVKESDLESTVYKFELEDGTTVEAKGNEMIEYDGPFILDVLVEKHENCLPMIPSGKPHNEMLLGDQEAAEDIGTAIQSDGAVLV